MYIYLISSGAYSDYAVDRVAAHEKKCSQEYLDALVSTTISIYKEGGHPVARNRVKQDVVEQILSDVLRENGFHVVYPVGEFSTTTYNCLEDIRASVPWEATNKEPSALRIGLA